MNHLKIRLAVACIAAGVAGVAHAAGSATVPADSRTYRVWPHALDPKAHPSYARVHAKPVDPALFGGRYEFVALKGRSAFDTNQIERMTRTLDLGRLVHPEIGFFRNPQDVTNLVTRIRERDLILYGPWWQVPAWGRQVHPTKAQYDYLERELGGKWFGMENGEQDNRYLRTFCRGKWPQGGKTRFEAFCDFERFFDSFGDWMGQKMELFTVQSPLAPHLLREGTYTCVGMETSQNDPNTQVHYAFLRGAGKQYGVPWFGDISLFGRWGWKNINRPRTMPRSFDGGREDMGTSYALMKRLAYELYFYNTVFGSMEAIQFDKDGRLVGFGRVQKALRERRDRYGDPGVMYAPVAVVLDAFSGWIVPRAVRSGVRERAFVTWGTIPYGPGDYLTHGVFDILYPGYEAGSRYLDERGYVVGTPFGDIADAVLSDAPAELLKQYAVVVLAGEIAPTAEFRDALADYLADGGHLVLTEGNRALLPENAAGRVTVIGGAPWGVARNPAYGRTGYDAKAPRWGCENDRMAVPEYVLTPEATSALKSVFGDVALWRAERAEGTNAALSVIACRRGEGEWSVAVLNNSWRAKPFALQYAGGAVEDIGEIPTVALDRSRVGYLPEGTRAPEMGDDTATTIAGGSVRTFRVRTRDTRVTVLPRVPWPDEPKNRALALRGRGTLREQILARPTFHRHWDGVLCDARYLLERSAFAAEDEARWLRLRKIGVMVDFTDLIDRYPGIRLTREDPVDNARSDRMTEEICDRMKIYGVRDAIVALHHDDVNTMHQARSAAAERAFRAAASNFVARLAASGARVHLRMARYHGTADFALLDAMAKAVGARRTFSTAAAWALTKTPVVHGEKPLDEAAVIAEAARRTDDLWLLALPGFDGVCEEESSLVEPLTSDPRVAGRLLSPALRRGTRLVFEAAYRSEDEAYRDARLVENANRREFPNSALLTKFTQDQKYRIPRKE